MFSISRRYKKSFQIILIFGETYVFCCLKLVYPVNVRPCVAAVPETSTAADLEFIRRAEENIFATTITRRGFPLRKPTISFYDNYRAHASYRCAASAYDACVFVSVSPKPVRKRKVADECCKTPCTIRYIYDTYCVNRTTYV